MAITDLIQNPPSSDPVSSYMRGYGFSQNLEAARQQRAIQEQNIALNQRRMAQAEQEDMRARGQEYLLSISPVIEKINALGTPEEKQAAYAQAVPLLTQEAQRFGLPTNDIPDQWDQNRAEMVLGAAQRLGGVERFAPGNVLGEDTFTQIGSSGTVKTVKLGEGQTTSERKEAETRAVEGAKTEYAQQQKMQEELGKIRAKAAEARAEWAPRAEQLKTQLSELVSHPGFKGYVGMPSLEKLAAKYPSSPAAGFKTRYDQIKGAAYAMAYQTLKGGGAITEYEAKTVAESYNRINSSTSEKEFIDAVRDFMTTIENTNKSLADKASGNFDFSPYVSKQKPITETKSGNKSNREDLLNKY